MYKISRLCAVTFMLMSLSSCSMISADKSPIRSITVCAMLDANRSYATDLDLLFILDDSVKAFLPSTSGEWFEQKAQILARFSDENLLTVSLEIVPLSSGNIDLPKGHRGAIDVIAYANYVTAEGQNWEKLPESESVVIVLGPENWSVSDTQCGA